MLVGWDAEDMDVQTLFTEVVRYASPSIRKDPGNMIDAGRVFGDGTLSE